MKSILQSTMAWFSGQLKREEAAVVTAQPTAEVIHFKPAAAPTKVSRLTEQSAPTGKPSIPSILYTGGPALAVMTRGSVVYGTCPQCQATWNIRERLLRHKLGRADESKALTCPACDHAVGLPTTVDLRKLS